MSLKQLLSSAAWLCFVGCLTGATLVVDNVNDAGAGSLRQAMLDANASSVADMIYFNIPGSGIHTIAPASELPELTGPVVIDGYTQPGAIANLLANGFNATLRIRLDGAIAGPNATGLRLSGGGSTVRGLIIVNFGSHGLVLSGGSGNIVNGNLIGLDIDGEIRGNGISNPTGAGILITNCSDNTIGGTTPGLRNVISGNSKDGIRMVGTGVRRNSILGNFIGTDIQGISARGNEDDGIELEAAPGNFIGGVANGAGNLISGNAYGIYLNAAASNSVQGNLIGCDIAGVSLLGNTLVGLLIDHSAATSIGDTNVTARNVISGNGLGVQIYSTEEIPLNTSLLGNFIGTDATGTSPLGNSGAGVVLFGTASGIGVGGTNLGAGNIIGFNTGNGVVVRSSAQASIRGNSIFANGLLGIDLGSDGVTPNDPDDADSGGNQLQNFPDLTSVVVSPGRTIIQGILQSLPNAPYRIEFFANDLCDGFGYGEGQTWLGATNRVSDAAGRASFAWTLPVALPPGQLVTTTVTDAEGNTSEFSECAKVVPFDSVELGIAISESADPVGLATNLTYRLTVTNSGPTNATSVIVTQVLAGAFSLVSVVPSQGGCSNSGSIVRCQLGTISRGSSATVTVTLRPSTNGTIQNLASVTAAEADSVPENNFAFETTAVGISDLSLLLVDSPDPVVAGQAVTLSLMVTNRGPDPATAVKAMMLFTGPSIAVHIVSAMASNGLVTTSSNSVTYSVGSIAARGLETVTATVIPLADGVLTTSANVRASEFDPDSTNNYTDQSTAVSPGAGVLMFESAAYTASEGGPFLNLRVQRTGGSGGGVAASFSTIDGSAHDGNEYTRVSGTLDFASGETFKTFAVPILDDFAPECPKMFRAFLSNATGGAILAGTTNVPITIMDNDVVTIGGLAGISVTHSNEEAAAHGTSESFSLSRNGRLVAFGSTANDLVAGDDNNLSDVFARDLMTRTTSLVSVSRFGNGPANRGSDQPALSPDGRFIAFRSFATDLTPNATGGRPNVFLRDLVNGTTTLISLNASQTAGGNAPSDTPAISSNGALVAFASFATDLGGVPDVNQTRDVFLRDLSAGATRLLSINRFGNATGNGETCCAVIADNGQRIIFESAASDLVPNDNNGDWDIFVRDLQNDTTTLVSANTSGTASGDLSSCCASASGDGRFIAFVSAASNLVAGDTDSAQDVLVRDLVTATTRLVSINLASGAANSSSDQPAISQDGRHVAFRSRATDLVSISDVNQQNDIFLRDLSAGTTRLISRNCDGTAAGNSSSESPAISADGRFVVFQSRSTDLVAAEFLSTEDNVFRHELQTGATTVLSLNNKRTGGGNGPSVEPRISADGTAVVFLSSASDLIPEDDNASTDVVGWKVFPSDSANVAIYQSDTPDPAAVGSEVTYNLVVRNNGPSAVTEVRVMDNLAPTVAFISANPSQGSCANMSGSVACQLGSLESLAYARITLVVRPLSNGFVTNIASVSANQPDYELSDNTAMQTTAIGIADLAVTLVAEPEIVAFGQAVTLHTTISNRGPDTAVGAWATHRIQMGMSIVTAAVSQGTVILNPRTAIATLGAIDAHSVATLTVRAIIDSNSSELTEASVSTTTHDPDIGNNTAQTHVAGVNSLGSFVLNGPASPVTENIGNLELVIVRQGEPLGMAEVSLATSNRTAAGGSDFSSVGATLLFTNGETSKSFALPIRNDSFAECLESFTVYLVGPSEGASVGVPSNAVVSIRDDDFPFWGSLRAASVKASNSRLTGNGTSLQTAISDDGSVVAFISSANDLAPPDTGTRLDVFVRNLLAGHTIMASVNRFGTGGGDRSSTQPVLSADGRYVVFSSCSTTLTTNVVIDCDNLFRHDIATRQTDLITVSTNNVETGNGWSGLTALSTDGAHVAFASDATNLVPDRDTNSATDVFIRDMPAGITRLVSINRFGTGSGNGNSSSPALTHDGQYVTFESTASDLVANDANAAGDVFVRDLTQNITVLVSVNRTGTASGNGPSITPSFSRNGRYVVFTSLANDLAPDDNNNSEDVFVRDLLLNTTRLVSLNRSGTGSGNRLSLAPSISADGRYVAFQSLARDLVPNDGNIYSDVFVRDLQAGVTLLVSANCDGSGSSDNASTDPVLSANGRSVVFRSFAEDLVPGYFVSHAPGGNVFRRDLLAGRTIPLSVNFGRSGSGNSTSGNPRSSADGRVVAFESTASDLVPDDLNGASDIFLWQDTGPRILSLSVSNDYAIIVWPAQAIECFVEAVSSLDGAERWRPLTGTLTYDGAFMRLVIQENVPRSPRFFRLNCP